MASTGADVVLVTETPPGVENGNTNLEEGLVRAVLAETTSSPTHTDNRFSNTFEEIMEDDTAEFDTFARQIEEMTKSTTTDYSEEREFGHLPPLKSSSSDLYGDRVSHSDRSDRVSRMSDTTSGLGASEKEGSPGANYYMDSGTTGGHSTSHSYRSTESLNSNISSTGSKRSFAASSDTSSSGGGGRRALQTELEVKLEERKRSLEASSSASGNSSGNPETMASYASSSCGDPESDPLKLMDRRHFRAFSRADEYLYAMKEDLAEWLNMLYPNIAIEAETFMDKLENGEYLVKHANSLRWKVLELLEQIACGETRQKPPAFSVPDKDLPSWQNPKPRTWLARDNVSNFIKFCRLVGVMECIMFETEDLVCRKNEKHVILTLLDVARKGAKVGMLAPMLVQFELEIDREIARGERERRKAEREEERRLRREEERSRRKAEAAAAAAAAAEAERVQREQQRLAELALMQQNNFDSMMVEVGDTNEDLKNKIAEMEAYEHAANQDPIFEEDEDDLADLEDDLLDDDDEEEEEEEEEEVEEDQDYEFPIGPMPQHITNDLKSLDEMVRELVSECECPTQFPMVRVSEGKYRIGDTQTLIFVRILRNHVMVRVGGGWDTLQHYLYKHGPCRCKSGHRASQGCVVLDGGRNGKMAAGVRYDRCDSPGNVNRRRSSSQNLLNRQGRRPGLQGQGHHPGGVSAGTVRSASLTPLAAAVAAAGSSNGGRVLNNEYNTGSNNSTPRGSLSNIHTGLNRGRASSLNPNSIRGIPAASTPSQQPAAAGGGGSVSLKAAALLNNSRLQSAAAASTASPQLSRRQLGSAASGKPAIFEDHQGEETGANGETTQPSHSVSGPSKKSSTESSKGGQICDSSSEVSDEGYKSSQGISLKNNNHQPCSQEGLGQAAPSDDSKTKNNSSTKIISDKTADGISKDSCSDVVALSSNSSQEGNGFERPISGLTGDRESECSSTISSEDDEPDIAAPSVDRIESCSKSKLPAPEEQPAPKSPEQQQRVESPIPPPPTPPISPTDSSISASTAEDDLLGRAVDTSATSRQKCQASTPSGGKIPKLRQPNNRQNSSGELKSASKGASSKKSNGFPSRQSSFSGVTSSGYGRLEPVQPAGTGTGNRMNRSRSASGDQINSPSPFSRGAKDRHSLRAGATSRYMQAAEAYTAKSREARSNSRSDPRSFWGPHGRGRESSSGSGFFRTGGAGGGGGVQRSSSRNSCTASSIGGGGGGGGSRPASRNASVSPGPVRRQRNPSGQQADNLSVPPGQEPTSTHSTPARRHPVNGGKASNGCHKGGGGVSGAKSSRNLSEAEAAGTTDNDDLILKRMEEILMTYKSKVEDHLAAEGRELPKEIFEDFTSRWVQNQAQAAAVSTPVSKSRSNGSLAASNSTPISQKWSPPDGVNVRTTPLMRKERRDGSDRTRIPMPTYYSNNLDGNVRN